MKQMLISTVGEALTKVGLAEVAGGDFKPERSVSQLRRHIDIADYLLENKFHKDFRILDVGCGVGLLAKRLKEYGFTHIDGLDWMPSEKVTHLDQISQYKQLDLNKENLAESYFKDKYDVIISSDVVEHLEAPAKFFRQVKPLLKDDGHLIVTIPNAFNLMQRVSFLLTGNSTRYKVEQENEFGHISILTSATMTSLLNRAGLRVLRTSGGAAFVSKYCIMPEKKFGPWLSFNLLYDIQKTQS